MSIQETSLPVQASPLQLQMPTPAIVNRQAVLTSGAPQSGAVDRFEAPPKVIIRSSRSDTEMRAAGAQVLNRDGNFLIQNGQTSAAELKKKLEEGQATWNSQVVMGLNVTDEIENKNGLDSLNAKQLNELQVRALTQPESIQPELWDSIPNKHFESANIYENNQEKQNLLDWSEKPERRGNERFGFYQGIKDNFKDIKNLSVAGAKDVLNEINAFEEAGWQKTYTEEELFGRPQLPPNTEYIEAPSVTVKLSNEQIKNLQQIKSKILEEQTKGKEAFTQTWNLGEILRTTKSVRDIMADPHYIKEKLLDPTQEALRTATPEAIPFILYDLQKQVEVLLQDVCGLKSSSLANLEGNTNFESLTEAQKQASQEIIKSVVDRVASGLESSSGRQITEAYAAQVGSTKSPLGELPSGNNLNQSPKLSEAYSKLQELLQKTARGTEKLTFEKLLPIAAQIQENTTNQTEELSPSSDLAKSINETENSLGIAPIDRQKMSPPDQLFDKATLASFADKVQKDPVIAITDYTKAGFDAVFAKDENFVLLNMQLGFVPFETDSERQKQLEVILNSKRFSHIFSEQNFQLQDKTVQITPALLSRTKYLYYQIINSQERERAKVLSEIRN